jgi:hypothetical protein
MSKKPGRLDNIQIQKNCSADWQQMIGNDQMRFCKECNKQVYNLSAMTRRQAEALIVASKGNLCVRLNKQADGTTLTADELVTLPAPSYNLNRRASPIAGAVVSAILAVSPCLAAQTNFHNITGASVFSENGETKASAKSQGGAFGLKGVVKTYDDKVIAGATLMLINESTNELAGAVSSETGEYEIQVTSPGVYILRVEAEGFKAKSTHGIALKQHKQRNLDMALESSQFEVMGAMAIPAEPLRELYSKSDRVVVATVGKIAKVQERDGSRLMKAALTVSSTLKGEHKATLNVYDWLYGNEKGDLIKNEKVLIFLQRRESKNGLEDDYEVSGYKAGVKALSDETLKIYLQRIEELRAIDEKEQMNQEELIEWLVRCVEDEATRSEGAYELGTSARQLRYSREAEKSEEDKDAEAQEAATQGAAEPETEATFSIAIGKSAEEDEVRSKNEKLLSLVTPQQKNRLMNILFKATELKDIEYNLVELAIAWKDARIYPFLITHLRRVQANPPQEAQSLVWALSEYLHDETIRQLAERYIGESEGEAEEDDSDIVAAEQQTIDADKAAKPVNLQQEKSLALKKFLSAVEAKLNETSKNRKVQTTISTNAEAKTAN